MTEENGKEWIGLLLLALLAYSVGLAFTSSSIIVFFEPRASGSGIPETSALLNGIHMSNPYLIKMYSKFFFFDK